VFLGRGGVHAPSFCRDEQRLARPAMPAPSRSFSARNPPAGRDRRPRCSSTPAPRTTKAAPPLLCPVLVHLLPGLARQRTSATMAAAQCGCTQRAPPASMRCSPVTARRVNEERGTGAASLQGGGRRAPRAAPEDDLFLLSLAATQATTSA
jgi:hypothetical protein